jgi:lipoyl(octanoyl) transferase
MPYRDAWAEQERVHRDVAAGAPEQLLIVEHPPVVTLGRRPDLLKHLLIPQEELTARGVQLVETDRGGDITFHGPGQIVVYPIIRLIDHRLSVGGYVHGLEDAVIEFLKGMGIHAARDRCAVGVWVNQADGSAAKIAAIGVRIRRGATLHGLALNVTTDLSYFDFIVPCGLANRSVTSIQKELGSSPPIGEVKNALGAALARAFDSSQRPGEESVPSELLGVHPIHFAMTKRHGLGGRRRHGPAHRVLNHL